MQVAFIITVYKNDSLVFFKEAIESIVKQDYGFHKINIYLGIDGLLSKNVEEYINKNSQLFHKIIKNVDNKGLAFTLNKLIETLEKEQFVFRMDSDDVCYLDRVSKQVLFMNSNKHIQISGGSIEEFNEIGLVTMVRSFPKNTKEAKNFIFKGSIFAHPSVCFSKLFFEKGFRYNTSHQFSQDLALWFDALENKIDVGNIEDIILKLRVSNNFFYRRSRKKAIGEFKIYYRGIISSYGFSFKLIYPIARFITRLLPVFFIKILYNKGFRKILNSK